MPEAGFTFDELNAKPEPQSYSFDDLNRHVDGFTFDELSKPQLPQFDASSARGPDAPERPTPPDTGPSQTGWGGQGMGFGANDPVLPIGDLIFNHGGINPGFKIAKQAVSAISPKAAQFEKGSEETARETLNGLTTPKNLALMLGSLGIASTGATAARLVSALWATVMGKQAIEDAPKIATEIGTEVGSENPDYAKIGKGLSQLGVDALFTVAPAIHATSGLGSAESSGKVPTVDRGEALAKMANDYEASRATDAGSPFMRAAAAEGPISMGFESGRLPALGETPTFQPSGLDVTGAKEVNPIAEEFQSRIGRQPTPEELQRIESGEIEFQEPPDRVVEKLNMLKEQKAQELRNSDFSKAVAEKVLQDHEPPVHPEKPLTENQLRIIRDSLVDAVENNQIPGPEKGLIRGSALDKWADETIRTAGQKYYTGGMIELTAAALVKGAALLEKGVVEFSKWSASMIEQFGDKIRPHLKELYLKSTETRASTFTKKQPAPTPVAQASPAAPAIIPAPTATPAPAPSGLRMAGTPPPVPPTAPATPSLPPLIPSQTSITVNPRSSLLSSLPNPQGIRERFLPIERNDSPAVARGFTETIQAGPRARTVIGDFLRQSFGKNKAEQERLAKYFVALGWDNRRIELQSRGIPAPEVPALTPQEAARIRADPKIQQAIAIWNREVAPTITDIRTRNQMIMSPNWGNADLMLNLPGEYRPSSQGKTGVNTADVYNQPAKGESSLQSDPVEALNQILRGHFRYDAAQKLANSIRRDVSIPPQTVVDPAQRANPTSFPSPRRGENFKAPYKGKMIDVKAIDLTPDEKTPDYHYVPLRVADAWEKQYQDRGVYNTWWDKIRGVAISGGILPASFAPHVYREVTAVAARLAQSGQSVLSSLPSWLGSNEYALYRMMSSKGGMRGTRYGQLMQMLVDRTGADRGSGFVDEPKTKIGRAINKPHDILFNPDSGVDVMARRAIADAALIKRFGVKASGALEKSVNDGAVSLQQAMKTLESRLNDADFLSVGREVNNTMGWGNTQTRTAGLNWLQRLLPFVSSESGKIPDEIRRFTTLNLDIPSMSKSVKRGEYQQTAKQLAASLANGAAGIYALSSVANFLITLSQTGKGQSLSDNPEGRRTDIRLAKDWYLSNLDPGLSRASRITGAKEMANNKGHEVPNVGRELVNEAFSVLDPTVRWLFVAATLAGGHGKNLYLNYNNELSESRPSDLIPFAPARNIINALGTDKPVAPGVAKDLAALAGAQLQGPPPSPEAIAGARRNSAIDLVAKKARQLPKDERRDYVRNELEKRGMWDSKSKARIGRMYPGLYKYED